MISSFCTMVHWGSFKGLNKIHFLFIKKHFWFVKKVCFHIYIVKMKNLRTNTVYVFILSFLESIFQDVFRKYCSPLELCSQNSLLTCNSSSLCFSSSPELFYQNSVLSCILRSLFSSSQFELCSQNFGPLLYLTFSV